MLRSRVSPAAAARTSLCGKQGFPFSRTNPMAASVPGRCSLLRASGERLRLAGSPLRSVPHSEPCVLRRVAVKAASAAAAAAPNLESATHNPLGLTYAEILTNRSRMREKTLPPPPKSSTFTDVLPYIIKLALAERQLWGRLGAAFCCLLVSKAAGLMCPLMVKRAVDAFGANPGVLELAVKEATTFLLLYGLCDILKHVSKELQAPLFTPVSQAVSRRVAFHTFSHVLGLDIRFHLDRRTGRLSRILERGTRSIQMLYRAVIFTFVPTGLELLFVVTVLAKTFSPLVGALVGATFCAYVAWSVVMTQLAADARKRVNVLDNATSAKAVDALLNYETVALFNNQRLEVEQYNEYLKGYMKASITTERLAAALNMGQAVILAIGLTAIMITAISTTKAGGAVSAGDLAMIQGLLLQLWYPLQFLGWFYRELRSALVDMEDFFDILRTQPTITDGAHDVPRAPPAHLRAATASVVNGRVSGSSRNGNGSNGAHATAEAGLNGSGQGAGSASSSGSSQSVVEGGGLHIALKDVKFGYSKDREILRGVSLSVAPGRSLAVVGPSGSGKSTILKLLTRLYDVGGGSVSLNGVDVRDLKVESLRQAVAVVPQDTVLFNDTIMQNIRYGRPGATDAEVIEAAALAHLSEAVQRMPDGFETMVGERGLKLSGGEKQRVAIARAFLRQPRLLVCDEATSALDSETEASIMASLGELAQGRTSVFVAHRLSTVRNCDQIVVLRNGVVVEEGSHDDLMEIPNGVYKEMWERQADEDREEGRATETDAPAAPGSRARAAGAWSASTDGEEDGLVSVGGATTRPVGSSA